MKKSIQQKTYLLQDLKLSTLWLSSAHFLSHASPTVPIPIAWKTETLMILI